MFCKTDLNEGGVKINMSNRISQKFLPGYRATALMFLNTLVALVFLNTILYAAFSVRSHLSRNPVFAKYGHSALNPVYPELNESEIDALLNETWSRPYIYEPFTQFKERPYQGTYIHVDTNGFRHSSNQGPWPPSSENYNIFLFGGSTTFGYGVSDDETIASYLQNLLNEEMGRKVSVYNFGQGYYYSTQERILFQKIILSGIKPDLAMFIDGLNDFYHYDDKPLYTDRFASIVEESTKINSNGHVVKQNPGNCSFSRLPMMRLVHFVRKKLSSKESLGPKKPIGNDSNLPTYDNKELLGNIITRYITNKTMIEAVAEEMNIKVAFVWQPVPMFKYNLKNHPFAGKDFAQHKFSQFGYPLAEKYYLEGKMGDNFLWCADIQQSLQEPLYVDQVHYSPKMSKILASKIVEQINTRGLLEQTK